MKYRDIRNHFWCNLMLVYGMALIRKLLKLFMARNERERPMLRKNQITLAHEAISFANFSSLKSDKTR